jgi:hypothetical protein
MELFDRQAIHNLLPYDEIVNCNGLDFFSQLLLSGNASV